MNHRGTVNIGTELMQPLKGPGGGPSPPGSVTRDSGTISSLNQTTFYILIPFN